MDKKVILLICVALPFLSVIIVSLIIAIVLVSPLLLIYGIIELFVKKSRGGKTKAIKKGSTWRDLSISEIMEKHKQNENK